MTRDQIIDAARKVAEKEGWPWEEPLSIEEGRRFILFGRRYWRVTTNSKYAEIGRNVHVQVDDESGEVLSAEYVPKLRSILPIGDQNANFMPTLVNTKDAIPRSKPHFPFNLADPNRRQVEQGVCNPQDSLL